MALNIPGAAENNLRNEVALGENEIICALTNKVVKVSDKELTLQSMISMMTEEYGFAPADMERDFKVKYIDENEVSHGVRRRLTTAKWQQLLRVCCHFRQVTHH